MKKRIFLLGVCLWLFYPYPVYATRATGEVIFSEDFSESAGGLLAHPANWQDYVIEFDFNSLTAPEVTVGFRYQDPDNLYELTVLTGEASAGSPEFRLTAIENGIRTPNWGGRALVTQQQWHHLKIEVDGLFVRVWIDDTFIFDAHLTANNLDQGGINLIYDPTAVLFKNLHVLEILTLDSHPVIFIPGIGGSEMKVHQDTVWSDNDGHGGTFSRSYHAGEIIWVNPLEAIKPGEDDYFDILRLRDDGFTSIADIRPTNSFISYSYQEVDPFFQSLGYIKGQDYFVFTYDWRRSTERNALQLARLVDEVLVSSGQSKVNLIAHSMGGLVARSYIFHPANADKVNHLIELGVPHLGTTNALKQLIDGDWLSTMVWLFPIYIIPPSEMHDLVRNFSSIYELLPHEDYFNQGWPFPLVDDRNFSRPDHWDFHYLRFLVSKLGGHLHLWPFILSTNTHQVKITTISGSGFPTLGQIHKRWLVTWPLMLIPIDDEIYINGDGTVPTQSSDYYVEQNHEDLTKKDGQALSIVRKLLFNDSLLATQATILEGQQITIENADIPIEEKPGVFYSKNKTTTQIFVRKNVATSTTLNPKQSTTIKVRTYESNSIKDVAVYRNIPTQPTHIQIKSDQTTSILQNDQPLSPTSQISGSAATDQTAPSTESKILDNQIALTASDKESGIHIIQYSLDKGQTLQTYTGPFTFSGNQIMVTSTDKAGNQEIPKTITFSPQPSPSPSPRASNSPNIPIKVTVQKPSSTPSQVLGIQKETPLPLESSLENSTPWMAFLLLFPAGLIFWKIIY